MICNNVRYLYRTDGARGSNFVKKFGALIIISLPPPRQLSTGRITGIRREIWLDDSLRMADDRLGSESTTAIYLYSLVESVAVGCSAMLMTMMMVLLTGIFREKVLFVAPR